MLGCNFLIAGNLSSKLFLKLLALATPLFEVLFAFGGDLQVSLHALFDLFLVFSVLSEKHLPASHVVHCLIFVRHQVALYHRTILHSELEPVYLCLLLTGDLSKTQILTRSVLLALLVFVAFAVTTSLSALTSALVSLGSRATFSIVHPLGELC